MIVFASISLLIFSIYVIQILLFIYGFKNIKPFYFKNINFENYKYLSVIIPFKNEKENINQLVKNLNIQSLSKNNFEVIFVNDNSNDNSESILTELIKDISNFKLINSEKQGKKNALKEGIIKSDANVIVTSDADCIHQKYWLENILRYYLQYKPKMIIAPVLMTGRFFFQKLQAIDFLSLTSSTAGAAGIKHPIMCNGANLIYEKPIFNEFNDALKSKEISGDDIFLLHNIKKKYPNDIHYLKSKDAIVYTEAEKSIKSFFKQRIRWASKSKSYNDFDTILSSLIVFSTNFLIVILLFTSFFVYEFAFYLSIIWGTKILIDFIFLLISGKYFTKNKDIFIIPFLSIIYPFYVSYIAIVSIFMRKTSWK